MSSGGGPSLEQLRIDVVGDDTGAQKELADLTTGLKTADAAAQSASGTISTVGKASVDASASAATLKTQIASLKEALAELIAYQAQVGVGFKEQFDAPIANTKTQIATLEEQLGHVGSATTTSFSQAGRSITQTTSQISDLKTHLAELQAVQERGRQAGFFTPGLEQEINRISSALKSVTKDAEEGGQKFTLSFSPIRGLISGISEELLKISGTDIPGLSNLTGILGGIGEKAEGAAGLTLGLAVGVATVAAVAVVATSSLTVLGAELQQTTAGIAAAGNVSTSSAREISASFGTISGQILEDATAIGRAWIGASGELTAYAGHAIEAGQATEFMHAAGEGADASGEKLTSTTRALAQELIATHGELRDVDEVMNTLYITSRNTGLGMDQVSTVSGRLQERLGALAPSAEQTGVALSLAAQSGAVGARGMQLVVAALESLADPSERAKSDLESMGVVVEKNAKGQLEVASTLQNLRTGYDGLSSTAQQHAVAEDLVGKSMAPVLEALLKTTDAIPGIVSAYEDHNRVTRDAQTQSGTLEGNVKSLGAQIGTLASEKGGALADMLVHDGQLMSDFGTHIHDASTFLGDLVEQMGHFSARNAELQSAMANQAMWVYGPESLGMTSSAAAAGLGGGGLTPTARGTKASTGPAAEGEGEAGPLGIDATVVRNQNEMNIALGTTGEHIHNIMTSVSEAPASSADMKNAVNSVADATARQADAWLKAFDPAHPEQAAQRVAELKRLTNEYTEAVDSNDLAARRAAQTALDSFEIEVEAETRRDANQKKTDTYNRQQAAEAKRIADEQKRAQREANLADPLYGMAQGMERDRDDLMGTAGKVMGDLNAMLSLQGKAGASEAGKQFATEARAWGQEMQKAGIPGFQDAFDQLITLGKLSVTTHSPEVVEAIHDMLADGVEQIKQANLDKAMLEASTKANAEILGGTRAFENSMAEATASAANSQLAALQSEQDREYDVWAAGQLRILNDADKHAMELQRIRHQREQEDSDKEEATTRATADRATTGTRRVADINLQAQQAKTDAERHQQEAAIENELQHQERLAEIKKKGGPGMAAAITSENDQYTQGLTRTHRTEQTQEHERQIRVSEQVAQAQRQAREQESDAQRRAQEQQQDLQKRRDREDQTRVQAQADETALNGPGGLREQHERAYHVDAESRAQQRYQSELMRIDAEFAHRAEKAEEVQELSAARARSQETLAGIAAEVKVQRITPEEGAERSQAEQARAATEMNAIQMSGRQVGQDIDTALRAQQAALSQSGRNAAYTQPSQNPFTTAPGSPAGSPAVTPYSLTTQAPSAPAQAPPWLPQSYQDMLRQGLVGAPTAPGPVGTPPTPIDYKDLALMRPIQILVQVGGGSPASPQEIGNGIKEVLMGLGGRAEVTGAVPSTS